MGHSKGFSLVELIIVIAIMAVLVGVMAPQYIKYVEKSRVSTDESNASEILGCFVTALADETSVDGMQRGKEYLVTWNGDGDGSGKIEAVDDTASTQLVENATASLGTDTVKVRSTTYKSSVYTIDVYYSETAGGAGIGFLARGFWVQ